MITAHPFFVNGKWIEAGSLKAGDTLQSENGKQQTVQSVEIKAEPLTAYNLTVADFHTYFVKGQGALTDAVWVHNECDTADKPKYSGDLVKVTKPDAHADALAEKIRGQSRVRFANDPEKREFDAVSDKYIAQAKPASIGLGSSFRKQAQATFEAAKQTGRDVYYHFEGGLPSQQVVNKLNEYSQRYGVNLVIDTTSLFGV